MTGAGRFDKHGVWRAKLTAAQLTEEIDFLIDACGWSERDVEEKLGLRRETIAQRRRRARKRVEMQQLLTPEARARSAQVAAELADAVTPEVRAALLNLLFRPGNPS